MLLFYGCFWRCTFPINRDRVFPSASDHELTQRNFCDLIAILITRIYIGNKKGRACFQSEYALNMENFLSKITDVRKRYNRDSYIEMFVSGSSKFYAYVIRTPIGLFSNFLSIVSLLLYRYHYCLR